MSAFSKSDANWALHFAARQGVPLRIQEALDMGADIHAVSRHGDSALIMAAGGGHVDAMRLLLDAGAKIDLQGHGGDTALIAAAVIGYYDAVSFLIKRGAKLNLADKEDRVAIVRAALRDQPAIVRLLAEAGADATKVPITMQWVIDAISASGACDDERLLETLSEHYWSVTSIFTDVIESRIASCPIEFVERYAAISESLTEQVAARRMRECVTAESVTPRVSKKPGIL